VPRGPFQLATERLVIRMLARADITAFTKYRNDPELARYQDWELPYTRDLAHALVDSNDALRGPTPGEWVQLAITRTGDDRPGELLGDIAVWLDPTAQLATIGYTVARRHQRHGYAGEAVAAVVDWLFVSRKVHRVTATLDPANLASARVLERNGFRLVGIARSAALVRGEWSDDARFELLGDEWKAWKRRKPARRVALVPLESSNVRRVLDLDRAFSQRRFVSSVAQSYGDALLTATSTNGLPPAWCRAITADGHLAGFMMVSQPQPEQPHPYLWRFLIDWHYQGLGVGRGAIIELARTWSAAGATRLALSCVAGMPGTPEPFYRKLGFEATGVINAWGETEMTAPISRLV
jgi:RimJ/RimL family protein N-acetyltransferase